jgi:hypothetical protein
MSWRASIDATWALIRRAANEILRVPGAAIPGVLAPTIFFLGLTSVFGALDNLAGFPAPYKDWLIPVSLLQGAGFTGAATGVNLARDIEQGWFDRLLVSPAPRPVILAGLVLSAALRSLIPATFLLTVGFAIGVNWPGLDGLFIALLVVMGMGTVAACWGTTLALKYRSQSAAPLMQAGMLLVVLAAHGGALQPGHADPRGGAPGVHRQRYVGRHLARPRGAGGPGGAAGGAGAERHEPHGGLRRRSLAGRGSGLFE